MGFQFKTREYSSHLFPITLETYALFLPACEPKRMQMDHLALGNDSSKDAEKRSGGLVNAWSHPDIQCISLPRSTSSAYYLSTFPVMFDAMPGIFDGGHLSSAGDFSFANIFSIDFFACERWPSR